MSESRRCDRLWQRGNTAARPLTAQLSLEGESSHFDCSWRCLALEEQIMLKSAALVVCD